MLDYLELLMLKPSSYSWPSVRAFHLHPAKQIELCHLEWTRSPEIRNKTVMFFKHSDLKLSQTKTSSGATSANLQSSYFQPRSPSTTKSEMEKDCRQWDYYDSCSWHKSNSHAFNAHHKCRMCTKEHPMLHCPKRRNPIPPSNTTSMWLLCESLELEQPTFLLTKDSCNDTCTSSSNLKQSVPVTSIIQHILASRQDLPDVFGTKIPVHTSLNIGAWDTWLRDYRDRHIISWLITQRTLYPNHPYSIILQLSLFLIALIILCQ